jgi:hypothetical protein
MKTTLDLPDEIFVAAKKRAADERRPLRDLVARSLRAELAGTVKKRRQAGAIVWVTVRGGLPPDLDMSDREAMHDRLRRRS